MTTQKIQPNSNWYKCSDTTRTEIRAFKSYLDESNHSVKLGGYNIEMMSTVMDDWVDFYIDIIDETNRVINQIVIKTTLDQIIKIKPTKLAFYIKEKEKKNYNHAVNMGRFHFYDDKQDKLFDESEVKKVKKLINNFDNNSFEENLKQIDLEDLIKEKKGK